MYYGLMLNLTADQTILTAESFIKWDESLNDYSNRQISSIFDQFRQYL